jgi:hypothetical protein
MRCGEGQKAGERGDSKKKNKINIRDYVEIRLGITEGFCGNESQFPGVVGSNAVGAPVL